MPREDDKRAAPGGLMSGFTGLVRHAAALALTRFELAAIELGEVRAHAVRLLLTTAAAVIAFCFALACWTAMLIVLAWDAMGWTILLLLAGLYTLVAAGMLLHARSLLHSGKLALPATMAELRKDRDTLFSE